jgi:hypothetical protein
VVSQGFKDWVEAGKPYTLIRPARALQRNLSAHGLTVYDYPDNKHLTASPPEDHTPFSATGFPGANRRWNARALDIMPRSGSAAHRKENADIARQLIRDRDAGVPGVMWIKYINWTAEDGRCRQERWTTPDAPLQRTTKSSTDDGHIHVSGRSDVDDDSRAEDYDPIDRMTGDDDMDDLTRAKIDAMFNVAMATKLPGGGDKVFPVPFTVKLNEILAAAKDDGTPSAPTDEQWATLLTLVRKAAEDGAEAALRRVLGSLDGATPPQT